MFVQRVALEAVPSYAVVDQATVTEVLRGLTDSDLRFELDRGFRRVEMHQPALGEFISGELDAIDSAPGQALAYFLFLVVYQAFEAAVGPRLGVVSHGDLERCFHRLVVDGELRRDSCQGHSYSEDAIALGQPALMALINDECDRAAELTPDVDRIFEGLLVELLVLTEAVAPLS